MERLKKRADFLRAARGIRRVEGAITLETCPAPELAPGHLSGGLTATKKNGTGDVPKPGLRQRVVAFRDALRDAIEDAAETAPRLIHTTGSNPFAI